ncbi:Uncharacterized membrane protein [Shimia gijangensis]|uniref:Uncharacterized membrane protein n=1 Tax=Shimia gijangensis TaxID=1470563 RepID=A0A1M6HIZ0_9RHOB|nr:DUF1036 domain-containing protein [Shimia gijangensis]SHJ22160.1 Uncharacterized membrane protein [Shimia gijangensis]
MKFFVPRITLIAALSTSMLALSGFAQSDDEFDAFGVTADGTTLDELVPETDELPPPQPYFEDAADAAPATTPTEATAPLMNEPTEQSEAPSDMAPGFATFDAPSNWVSHEIKGFHFKAPPDWKVVVDKKDSLVLFAGDMATRTGATITVMFDRHRPMDDDEGELLSQSDVRMPNGEIYLRAETALKQGDVAIRATAYSSSETNEDDDYTTIALAAMNQPYEHSAEILESILGTLVMPETYVKPRDEGLGGMVSFDLPKGWSVHHARDDQQVSFRSQYYSGYGEVATGHWITDEGGLDSVVTEHASAPETAQIFGYPATRQTWQGSTPEFYAGAAIVMGEYTYYRLTQCLSNGEPVAVMLAGAPDFLGGEDLAAVLASVELNLPDGITDCPAEPSKTPVSVQSTPLDSDTQVPATAPSQAEASMPLVMGTAIDVEGVTFVLPEGWETTYDTPADKMFQSPDGRTTILAFWWFPDEPLTGYDDDVTVKNVMIDHESVTQIMSKIGDLKSVLNVSERARSDEKRFIFTVESNELSLDELNALNETLIKNLRLQPALDPNWQAPQPTSTSSPLPAPEEDTASPGASARNGHADVRFGNSGLGKWRGEHVTLSNPGSGSPSDDGELEASALGDGKNGYFLAPNHVLGDWRGTESLRLVLRVKSGNGTYYSPYIDGGRGDIFLQSGTMSASIEFDHPVGTEWTTQIVRFDDPRWRVSGASSVQELLVNVTRFDVRAEYLNGDTRMSMAKIDWIAAQDVSELATTEAVNQPTTPAGSGERSTDVCDALYAEAKEINACFAYRAFANSCGSHLYAGFATAYIDENCAVPSTPNVPISPEPTAEAMPDRKQDSTAEAAGLRLCNATPYVQTISIGYHDVNDNWTSEGWWDLKQDKCVTVVSGDLKKRYYFYRAEVDGGPVTEGDYMFCTSRDEYIIVGDTDCVERGYKREGFAQIDTGPTGTSFVFTLTEAE